MGTSVCNCLVEAFTWDYISQDDCVMARPFLDLMEAEKGMVDPPIPHSPIQSMEILGTSPGPQIYGSSNDVFQ